MLTVDTIVDELVQRGLVTLRDVVHTGVEAAEVRGRNAKLRVSLLEGRERRASRPIVAAARLLSANEHPDSSDVLNQHG
jgi:hypothetical protein